MTDDLSDEELSWLLTTDPGNYLAYWQHIARALVELQRRRAPVGELGEVAREWIRQQFHADGHKSLLHIALTELLSRLRNETIEECAKVAAEHRDGNPDAWDAISETAKRIAAAIRAMGKP